MDKITPNVIGITGKPGIPTIGIILKNTLKLLKKYKIPFVIDTVLKPYLSLPYQVEFLDFRSLPDSVNVLIVLGGDGTLIRAVHEISNIEKRLILGVNIGRIGFLSEIMPYDLAQSIERMINGEEIFIEEIRLMEVEVLGTTYRALNDIVVMGKEPGSMILIKVYLDGEPICATHADGIIVSTSIGSTAYSASAGGPIIDPRINAFIINFICPLMWALRPLIVPATNKLRIRVRAPEGVILVDGMRISTFKNDITLTPRYSKDTIKFIRFSKGSFYRRLYHRLTAWV
ncbi:MAG: NAD(+)/NADH kinase [Thermoprotei archaeon]|nr:NAD(+)/NADH kinase [Thermoprotei archaeon]